ncbi:MAG: sugar phosphate nucleotidyltransferase [Bacteroidota bacterium]|nr:sugar phosphate nucleotidyltransferase [Bacteroidota bacterium]
MEEFLGILFCGGRGARLGEITKYISKSFVPVYNTPVFKFGLKLLENSKSIGEIIILTNNENDEAFQQTGYKTIIQDDSRVNDMLSGWEFIKEVTQTRKHGVLVPGDNICEVRIDKLIEKFRKTNADFLFSLHRFKDKKKLAEMGSFDIKKNKFYYKNLKTKSKYGVIAPYIIKNSSETGTSKNIFESENTEIVKHKGYWFDIGGYDSLIEAGNWRQKNKPV